MRNTLFLPLLSTLACACAPEGTMGSQCAPKATQQCTCSAGQGYQICADDGSSWGACQCSGNPSDPGQSQSPAQPQAPTQPQTPGSGQPQTPTNPSGQTGTMTCAQVDTCMMNCNENDNTCFDNCLYQGTANAQTQMTALENCLSNAEQGACQSQCVNYDQQCDTCLDQACQSELTACLGTSGGTGGTGTMTCAQIDSCMMNCSDTDYACFDTCFYQGTANAQTLMTAVENCYMNAEQGACQSQCVNYDQQCDTCLDQACQSEVNTCLSN